MYEDDTNYSNPAAHDAFMQRRVMGRRYLRMQYQWENILSTH